MDAGRLACGRRILIGAKKLIGSGRELVFNKLFISISDNDQTLVMYSGHPFGIFPSAPESPRCIITNGEKLFQNL